MLNYQFFSESQFKRCINQSFGVTVSENDFNQIKEAYGSAKNIGMINYREFVNGLHENGNFLLFKIVIQAFRSNTFKIDSKKI